MKALPVEPRDPSKACYFREYFCWFTQGGMFKRIVKDAEKNNWKIVGYQDKFLSLTVTFQDR